MVQHRQVITNLFRYHDTMLYEAGFEDLFTMELPTAEGIRSAIDGSTDVGFKAYLDRIPLGMRQVIGANIKHLYLVHQNSCLCYAA